ncbi:MAG TPA: hypothetical protein VLY04_15965 [Bryobacteraceae bacterium]|nr:hypothetical protein [Bryobacteraceae bacterium]
MSFQWLQMRISEEKDRRQREAVIQQRLPLALEELHQAMLDCVAGYTKAFGEPAADLHVYSGKIRVTVREEQNGKWEQRAKVEISVQPKLPGLRVEYGGEPMEIEVGMLPDEKTFYKDGDKYLTMEELTRRILDRVFFPKLSE